MNKDRRTFLKILFIGGGALFVEGVLGSLFSKSFYRSSTIANSFNKPLSTTKNFRVIENSKGLSIYDSSGEEVFQIDKRT